METIKDIIQRFKEKAKVFLEGNVSAFIENFTGDYYFCDVIEVQENFIIVKGFAGQRNREVDRIFFVDIKRLEEYEELRERK